MPAEDIYETQPDSEIELNLYGIVSDSIVDGPGLRLAVFFQGCPHHCPGCHNPQSWDYGNRAAKLTMTVSEVLDMITPVTRGLTVSGGEPFSQQRGLLALVREARRRGIDDIWVWSGWTWSQLRGNRVAPGSYDILKEIDVLVDGRYIEEYRSPEKPWVGSWNQQVIDVPASMRGGKAVQIESVD